MESESITFLAYIPALQSAIQIHGGGDGLRLKLDVPEIELRKAQRLIDWRERVLRVTVEPDDGSAAKSRKLHI